MVLGCGFWLRGAIARDGEEWLGMDPAPRMAVDAFGERVGRLLVIDGESYQPSASCLWNYAWDPHRTNFPLPFSTAYLLVSAG